MIKKLNAEFPDGTRVEDVATKTLSIFGEKGKKVGQIIDEKTKHITIKIEEPKKQLNISSFRIK